jgi:DNA-binding protein HU-beta
MNIVDHMQIKRVTTGISHRKNMLTISTLLLLYTVTVFMTMSIQQPNIAMVTAYVPSTINRIQPQEQRLLLWLSSSTTPQNEETTSTSSDDDTTKPSSTAEVNFRKSDFITALAQKTGMSKKESEIAYKAVFDIIIEQIQLEKKIKCPNFGTFAVKQRNERKGRNPQTGETIIIPSSKTPTFTPTKSWKDILNGKTTTTTTKATGNNSDDDDNDDDDEA